MGAEFSPVKKPAPTSSQPQSMIRKSGFRFSEKIMLKQRAKA
jgi:hypothetical protein